MSLRLYGWTVGGESDVRVIEQAYDVGFYVVGPDADGLAAGSNGLVKLALPRKGGTEVDMGLAKVGPEPDRGPELGLRGWIVLQLIAE